MYKNKLDNLEISLVNILDPSIDMLFNDFIKSDKNKIIIGNDKTFKVLKNENIKTNYNKKTKTVYVNPKDVYNERKLKKYLLR